MSLGTSHLSDSGTSTWQVAGTLLFHTYRVSDALPYCPRNAEVSHTQALLSANSCCARDDAGWMVASLNNKTGVLAKYS